MKTAMRIILTLFTFVASYFFIYWVLLPRIPGVHKIALLPNIVSLLLAIGIGVFVWKNSLTTSNNLATDIAMGGIIIGSIGLILGFFWSYNL